MEMEMGEVHSLEAMERCILRDFSDRVLVLHGLFGSPYSFGSYLLCEVDLKDAHNLDEPWKDENIEIVIQAIGHSNETTSCLFHNSRPMDLDGFKVQPEVKPRAFCSPSAEVVEPDKDNQAQGQIGTPPKEKPLAVHDAQLKGSSSKMTNANWTSMLELKAFIENLLSALAPKVTLIPASYKALKDLFSDTRSELNKEYTENTRLVPKSKASLNQELDSEKISSRHPNLVPILGAFEGGNLLYIVYSAAPYTLETVLHFSPNALQDDIHVRFFSFQLLSALAHCHSLGIAHGNLNPSSLLLTDSLWCWLTYFGRGVIQHEPLNLSITPECTPEASENLPGDSMLHRLQLLDPLDFRVYLRKWWVGELSNFDYLLLLNKLAGRRWGDRCLHTVMPWVIDFSIKPGNEGEGWRDLSKSKWHLAKGDEQLDFTYSTAEIPHHVSDECLSELAVCIYKARILPVKVLRRVVRSVYEPNEYPANMQRLYQWTPDECIPEFYSDASVFRSIHPGMSDLAVPDWAKYPEEFIAFHRAALESEHVSSQLHCWIDLTFGYQLSGEAAIAAKNVPLSTIGPMDFRSVGRRQLFAQPHPKRLLRQGIRSSSFKPKKEDKNLKDQDLKVDAVLKVRKTMPNRKKFIKSSDEDKGVNNSQKTMSLEELEHLDIFCEQCRHLSPCYKVTNSPRSTEFDSLASKKFPSKEKLKSVTVSSFHASSEHTFQSIKAHLSGLESESLQKTLESLKVERNEEISSRDFWSWKMRALKETTNKDDFSNDIFSAGCIIAEMYLHRPLFDLVSANFYAVNGTLPKSLDRLPLHAKLFVETILQEPTRRPTAQMLLDSPFFPAFIHSAYNFLSTLECFISREDRWKYVARMSKEGAFQLMGANAAEMCAVSCLSLVTLPYQTLDSGAVISLLQSMLHSLKPHVSKNLLVPIVQKLLQSQESGQLKLALLQSSFTRTLLNALGTSVYIQQIHASILGNLLGAESRTHGHAASSLLVEVSLELGLPVTLHQIVVPLLQTFGRDTTVHGIETLVEVGVQYGEKVVLKHLLPPLRSILMPLEVSEVEIAAPVHSWYLMAMVDALAVLDRLVLILPPATVITELLQEPNNVYVKILQRHDLHPSLLECAAKAILALCRYVGPDATSTFVLPQLKQLFNEVAFAGESEAGNVLTQENANLSSISLDLQDIQEPPCTTEISNLCNTSKLHNNGNTSYALRVKTKTEDRMNLVHILYPSLASIMGIEKLRQCLATWLLLEQCLSKHYGWKWEAVHVLDTKSTVRVPLRKGSSSDAVFDLSPASMLLNGVGWSIPQSLAYKWSKLPNCNKQSEGTGKNHVPELSIVNNGAWSWVPVVNDNWGTTESFSRVGATLGIGKDDPPWKLEALIVHSWKAQNGSLKAASVEENECEIYTAGGGSRNRSTVRQWKLSSSECNFEYLGHEEPVHDICIIQGYQRIASCDGTLHIWNSITGECVKVFSESGATVPFRSSIPSNIVDGDRSFSNGYNSVSTGSTSGILSAGWAGNLYTFMHYVEADAKLLVGTTNGSIRFIDITEGRRLFSWRCEPVEASLPSYVSAIGSSGGQVSQEKKHLACSLIAAGFSSGYCSLLDYRSGSVLGHWRAHGAAITKVEVIDNHYIMSSSLDKTLRLWDLRRGWPAESQVYQGHGDSVASFSLWNDIILSAAGNKIGLSTFSKTPLGLQPKQNIKVKKLYTADHNIRNTSSIVTISVLPFSRLFIVGTEDGFLKVCR